MATLDVRLTEVFVQDAQRLWSALADWRSHGDWIPFTKVTILSGSGAAGTRFVAVTGIGPVGFADHMTVTVCDSSTLTAEVEKTGPWLRGSAGFKVRATATGAEVDWFERILLPNWMQPLFPLITPIAAALFRSALRRLGKLL